MVLRALTILMLTAVPLRADPPSVVTDIPAVHSLTSALMAGVGEPSMLLKAGETPHNFALRPSQARDLQNADLVVWMGHTLTPQLEEPVESLAADAKVMELLSLTGLPLLEVRASAILDGDDHDDHSDEHGHDDHKDEDGHDDHAHDEHKDEDGHDDHAHDDHKDEDGHDEHAHDEHKDEDGHDDHAHDDHKDKDGHDDHASEDGHDDHDDHDHAVGGPDPHAWLDPKFATMWAQEIAALLIATDPENADTYKSNLASLVGELSLLDLDLRAMLADAKDKPFVVAHDALYYFESAYDLNAQGALSNTDAAPVGPGRMAEMRAALEDGTIKCALVEAGASRKGIEAVAPEGNLTFIEIDQVGMTLDAGPGLYSALMRGLADAVKACP
ncbi:MAG: zinc ABC transporter substrate-binding protein [Pseudomonadota bacterium]